MDYTRLKSVEEQTKKNAKDIEELSKAIHDLKQSSDNRLAFMKNQFASIFAVLSNKTAASQAEQPQVSIEQIGACKLIDKIPQSILGEVREEMTTGRAVFGQNGLKNEAHKMFEVMSKPVPTEKETSLSIEEPQALRNVDPILAVAAYNSVEVVFEVRHLPDYEGETTAKQILGVQSDFENGADKVLDGTTISVATGLQLFHPNHITEREYSSHSFSRNEVSSFLYNSLSFNPGNLFIDGGPQPPTLMIGSVEVTHRLFDKFPQLITVEPNQEMYADRYYIPPLLDCVLQIFDPGSSSLIVCCDFLDTSGVKHDFDKMPGNSNVELWFGKILSFVFDPGGSYLCYNGKERQDSAYSELQVLDLSSEFVCIHDSARPLMIAEDVEKVMKNGFIHVWQDKMFASVNYIADCFSIGSVLDLNEVPSKVAKVFAKPSTILLKAMLEVPFAFKRRETLFYIFLPICKRTLFGIWKLEVGFVNNSVNDLRTWKFGENKCKLVLLSSRKRKSVLAMVTTLEHFVWDPGQCAIFVYILEDKDVFKRVGNRIVRMDITWVIMEVSKDVQNNCIIMRWCEMARYLRLSCDNANDGYMLQTEHMVKG